MKNKWLSYITQQAEELQHPQAVFLYRKGVYLFTLLITLLQLPIAASLWGKDASIAPAIYEGNSILQSLNLLSHPTFASYYPAIVLLLILAIVASFFIRSQRILAILIFFCFSNLYHRSIPIQNGSSDLLHLQLFYLVLMDEHASHKLGKIKTLSVCLTNFAFIAAQVQLCVVYFISSYYKLQGTHWLEGTALHYALLNDEFTLDFVQNNVANMELPLRLLTWSTLLFQILFPVCIWIKKLKPYLLTFGIALHAFIALVMGIVDFGVLMIVMYLLFASEAWCLTLRNKYFRLHQNVISIEK